MIAVDTNILVHAHRRDSAIHQRAKQVLTELAEAPRPWGVPVHCLVEFYGITTHPKIWNTPSRPEQATDQIDAWRASPTMVLLGDNEQVLDRMLGAVRDAAVVGPKVHDARIAAVCLSHGVSELWTIDRDFSRFAGLRTNNPL